MKIALIDQDVVSAAYLALAIKNNIQNAVVEHYETIDSPAISTSSIVFADPAPLPTRIWLESFRRIHPDVPLVLISENTDLLSGSFKDKCYAFSKPVNHKDMIDLLRFHSIGKTYTGGLQDGKRTN